jgi:glutamate 5-kinase
MKEEQQEKWVVKVGSALLSDPNFGINRKIIAALAWDVANLKMSGIHIVVVSSGSIAEGMQRLGWGSDPMNFNDYKLLLQLGRWD